MEITATRAIVETMSIEKTLERKGSSDVRVPLATMIRIKGRG
jgi:hypothetical protein